MLIFVTIFFSTVFASQCLHGPCGPGNDMCGPDFDRSAPQFHVRDRSCGENDPNFPLYDAKHKLYHAFYQDHLAEDQNGVGRGPDIGHAVSADMVKWAHLPVAVWNDQAYDNVAIYTGSATIVNGTPTMVYPGLCVKSDWPACNTGTVYAVATPSNYDTDPMLTNWTKPSYNPIVDNVQRDPSTAWQTESGEWRFTGYTGQVWYSPDFVKWQSAGNGTSLFDTAECPDFFPLPPLCNGCVVPPNATLPTHVHKQSSSGQDWYTLGAYASGASGSTGTWVPLAGVERLQLLDYTAASGRGGMAYYASKGFWDPVQSRRIYWGWALVPPASTQTLPREVTYHPSLMRLLFNPIAELASLRMSPPLFAAPVMYLPGGVNVWLGDWQDSVGNQSEVTATFPLATAGTFGVEVLVGNNALVGKNVSFAITFSYNPANPSVVNISLTQPQPQPVSYYMPGVDLPGDDYNVTNVKYSDPHMCQAACTADNRCAAYTYVTRPPLLGSCCLKSSVPAQSPSKTCTSGVKFDPITFVPIPLLPGESSVDLRVFTDNTFLEIFAMGGRVAFTVPMAAGMGKLAAGMNIFSSGSIAVRDVNVWRMDSIWTTTEDVLAARKL